MIPRKALAWMALLLGCGGSGMAQTGTTTTVSTVSTPTTSFSSSLGGSGGLGAGGMTTAPAQCPVCAAPAAAGTISDAALPEISGVVASLAHPGVLWVHNDSGDTARFFAIDEMGSRLATFTVTGAQAIDWEDIARGPCPQGTCLYLADIGDNLEKRTSYTVYRVPEPAAIADGAVAAERFDFTYPDGSHNAETLLVHPVTGAFTIVTKVFAGDSSIFVSPLPLTPGTPIVLEPAGKISPASGIAVYTGGDVHPEGHGVLLRTYGALEYYPLAPGATVASALLGTPCAVPVASEAQGEAVGFSADGKGYVTIGEGSSVKVNRVTCSGL